MEETQGSIYENNTDDEYYTKVNRVLILVLVLNLFVAFAKIMTGCFYNILSMVSDGYDSFFDGISNITGIIAIRFAKKPHDKEHRYGHSKFETLASIFIALMLFYVSFEILHSVIDRFQGIGIPTVTPLSFIILTSTLVINILVAVYENRKGKELKSDILISDSKHTKSDVYATTIILIGMIFIKIGLPILDPLLSIVMAVIIIKTGLGIVYENVNILMDKEMIDDKQISDICLADDNILDIHNVRTHGTPANIYMDMHMVVKSDLTLEEAHILSHKYEDIIKTEIPEIKDVLIHFEPDDEIDDKIIYT
ncbi:cation diffusion facilitator family transporter [Methanosphaera cuniculi]|uniref:cation diffusion facilitator family transporter n=1 Tax=Methanosphaera cuniculi TaxID=1077256 RepID=UPI0026DB4D55|nr:cation diffusion facilitator family transporter [Methanosphaera cuniculi]